MTLPANSNVRKKIAKYQELSTKDECVIGSGMCVIHKVKVIRVLKPTRMSVINTDGSLGWRMSETTTLACPVSQKTCEASATSQSGLSKETCAANKKVRLS